MEELIRKMLAAAVGITLVPDAGTAAPIAAVPDGVQLKSLEQLLPAPLRTVGTTRLHQYPAFVAYVNKYKTPALKKQAEILLKASTFRFDGSDLMPGAVGAGSFWKGMVDFAGGKSSKEVADDIQKSWDAIK